MYDMMKQGIQGALSSANSALDWFKPDNPAEFKQPSYQGQGMLNLGIQSTIPSTIARPSMPLTELSSQEDLVRKAPGVAMTTDQAIMNYSKPEEKKEWSLDPEMLAMAMSGFEPQKQPKVQVASSRSGGYRPTQDNSIAKQLQSQAFGEVAGHGAKKWSQMLNLPY